MASWNGRLLYIDGFAGPGRYAGGEPGSPIVALNVAAKHHYPMQAELVCLFIEADEERKDNLEQEIANLTLPTNVRYVLHLGKFDDTVTRLLDDLQRAGHQIAPTFAFVDPFGWSHTPFTLIKRLLDNPSCEVLINFMYEEVNRFIGVPGHDHHFDGLFGTPSWRSVIGVQGAPQRRQFIHELYEQQLRQPAGARFVRSFEMRNRRNATDYYLFFATKNRKGLEKMKEAMWRVDPSGAFLFSDVSAGQPVLFQPEPDYTRLRSQIAAKFQGQTVPVGEVERFVVEETAFLATHYKRRVLAVMEKEVPPALQVVSPLPGRRRGNFPDGSLIRFV
jgi:three-Cys-motif partner protein